MKYSVVRHTKTEEGKSAVEFELALAYDTNRVSEAIIKESFRIVLQRWLQNNLREALGRADHANQRSLKEIVMVLHNYCPGNCWGSPENVREWASHRGLQGLRAER